jgi:hypothetical protein
MKIIVRLQSGCLWTATALSLMLASLANSGADKAGNTNGTSSATDPAQTYRDFLSDPPWIKKIVYRQDKNYAVVVDPKNGHSIRLDGLASYEAAIQPNGYYRKHLQGALIYDRRMPGRTNAETTIQGYVISGASKQYYWRYFGLDDIALVPRDTEAGASTNNWLRGFFSLEHKDLEQVCKLGLDALADTTIQWADKDTFGAVSPKFGHGRGKIVSYTNGVPEAVDYTIGTFHSVVRYQYNIGVAFPPHKILVKDFRRDGTILLHANYIDDLIVGIDPEAKEGYSPASFRDNSVPFKSVLLSSNQVLYSVDIQGRLHPQDTTYHSFSSLNHGGSRVATTGGVILFAVAACAFLLHYMMEKRKGVLKQIQQKTNICSQKGQ